MVNFNLSCFIWSQTLEDLSLNAFENGVLRAVFGPRSKEKAGVKKNVHNGEPHNFYSSPNTIKMIESRKVKWVGHAWEMLNAYSIGLVKLEEKMPYWLRVSDQWAWGVGVCWRLNWILKKWAVSSRMVGHCQHSGAEPQTAEIFSSS